MVDVKEHPCKILYLHVYEIRGMVRIRSSFGLPAGDQLRMLSRSASCPNGWSLTPLAAFTPSTEALSWGPLQSALILRQTILLGVKRPHEQ